MYAVVAMNNLNNNNFANYCIQNYDNPQCMSLEEFEEDCKRFFYLKKLFSRYRDSGDLKERLILNHLIIIFNVFGTKAGNRLLFLKLDSYYNYLIPFLIALNKLPKVVENINGKNINTSDYSLDQYIVDILRAKQIK